MGPKTGATHVLIVEDNEGDIRLIYEAFRLAAFPVNLVVARDGVEAMTFLHRTGGYSEADRPHLVLLDLSLPRKDGREVLSEIKTDPSLRTIPVIVLSGSSEQQDIDEAYGLHANCYIIKPTGLGKVLDMVRRIEGFWLDLVELCP